MISNTKTIKSHILIVDFNLNAVSWDQLSSNNKLQNDFLIMFENNCLTQLIKQPTHYLGNLLDILLTDKPNIISNLNIGDHKEDVSSYHFPISFNVLAPLVAKKVKQKKRKIYNFKKADWKAINEQLAKTDWNSILDGKDIHSAWHDFKTKIFAVKDFNFSLTTVLSELRNIDANKAVGPDGIHGTVLKMCAATLAFPITKIFNLSLNLGQIPSDWKTANVVPFHQKGDKCNIENYRPISLTSLVMKVMEKIIRNELYNKCQTLIHKSQHGFLPGKSCLTQMTNVIDDISGSLNKRNDVDMVYFDFAKAFDSVNHDIVLQKLKSQFGIDGTMLKFIKEYLRDRTQKVVIGDMSSSPLPVESGVPQGSILGPLLFVLFINDIYTCVSDGTNIALYADDTKIWRKIVNETDCILLNNDINSLNNWAIRNKMRFHPTKCKILSFS